MQKNSLDKKFFRPENNSHTNFNACVGNNGWVGLDTYINGFQSSTIILLEALQDNLSKKKCDSFTWCQDTAIYPILFSARHFLELFLKQQILRINSLKKKDENILNSIKTHNIHDLWRFLHKQLEFVPENSLDDFLKKIESFVLSIHEIDSTGETFRYSHDQSAELHLRNHSVIGLNSFYEDFLELSKVASEISYTTVSLMEEYRVGTYTKNLSRNNIKEIALSLPQKKNWNNQTLKPCQQNAKIRFGIGASEFREVLAIIEKHKEFHNLISDEFNLEIDENKLINFIINAITRSYENITFSLEDISCIKAIQEISLEPIDGAYFSEDFDGLKDSFLQEDQNLKEQEKENEIEYIYIKFRRTIKGLEKLGALNTLDKLREPLLIVFLKLIKFHAECPISIGQRESPDLIETLISKMKRKILKRKL